MVHKKLLACLVLCGITHNCMSMEYVSRATGATVEMVKSGCTTVNERMYPAQIFDEIGKEWPRADNRQQITLLQKLNRGFLDGLIPASNIPKLLDEVEATIPRYPVSPLTLDQINQYLASQIPNLQNKPELRFRAIKIMYLIRPRTLAAQITNNVFVVNVTNETERENIVNTTMEHLTKADDVTGVNDLVSAVKQNQQVTFGKTAQKTLITYLGAMLTKTQASLEHVRGQAQIGAGNNDNNP